MIEGFFLLINGIYNSIKLIWNDTGRLSHGDQNNEWSVNEYCLIQNYRWIGSLCIDSALNSVLNNPIYIERYREIWTIIDRLNEYCFIRVRVCYTAFRVIPFNFVFCRGIRVFETKAVFRTQHFIVT